MRLSGERGWHVKEQHVPWRMPHDPSPQSTAGHLARHSCVPLSAHQPSAVEEDEEPATAARNAVSLSICPSWEMADKKCSCRLCLVSDSL